jgi:hypothetical protein
MWKRQEMITGFMTDIPDLPIKTHPKKTQILAPSKGMTRTSYLAEKPPAGDFQSSMELMAGAGGLSLHEKVCQCSSVLSGTSSAKKKLQIYQN